MDRMNPSRSSPDGLPPLLMLDDKRQATCPSPAYPHLDYCLTATANLIREYKKPSRMAGLEQSMAGCTRLELATSDVTGRRSNQTELTPQADVRVCFRSRALRGLVYTEVCPARNNFFENIFWALREGLRGRLARVKFAALQSCARRKAH